MSHYFRVRMISLHWWVCIYDASGKQLHDAAIGPCDDFADAERKAKATGLLDMDKSDLPVGD